MLETLSLAIVDVETTGSSALQDRIIEIGIQRVERGRLVQTYGSLINPERPIPPIITQITGITHRDVEDAPTFSEVAERVRGLLDGCVFAAHNARFDYAFVRNEFERLERPFSATCLCTVRLSRRLYPEERHHNLGCLIERCGLVADRRHRALEDAAAVWGFLQHARRDVAPARFDAALAHLLKAPTLPPGLDRRDIDALPSAPGVYIFYDGAGVPLYVGRSADVRERVLSHFSSEQANGHSRPMASVARIDARRTYGELGARLLEAGLTKTLAPRYRRRSRERHAADRSLRRRMTRWPFPGPIAIEEANSEKTQGHLFLIDQWRLLRALRYTEDGLCLEQALEPSSDRHTGAMLLRHVLARPDSVRRLGTTELARIMGGAGAHEDWSSAI